MSTSQERTTMRAVILVSLVGAQCIIGTDLVIGYCPAYVDPLISVRTRRYSLQHAPSAYTDTTILRSTFNAKSRMRRAHRLYIGTMDINRMSEGLQDNVRCRGTFPAWKLKDGRQSSMVKAKRTLEDCNVTSYHHATTPASDEECTPKTRTRQFMDATAVSHEYLRASLGMTQEEIELMAMRYRELPAHRRGPEEVTMAGAELETRLKEEKEAQRANAMVVAEEAAAAARASQTRAAKATRIAADMVAASSGLASDPEAEAAVETAAAAMRYAEEREAAAKAAALAAVSVPIPRVPGAVVVLINHLDVPRERIKQILIRWPRLLEVSISQATSRVRWLEESLGTGPDVTAKLVLGHPSILIKSISQQLQPNLDFLEHTLGLTRPQATKAVCSCPQLITKSVASNFSPKLQFMEEVIGLPREHVSKMVQRYPQLFNASVENMRWKLQFLKEQLQLNDRECANVLFRCPALYAYSAERNLIPTLAFFREVMDASSDQMKRAVVRTPRMFGMSLERRLSPRARAMRKEGIVPNWARHYRLMLFASDLVFENWLRHEVDGTELSEEARASTGSYSPRRLRCLQSKSWTSLAGEQNLRWGRQRRVSQRDGASGGVFKAMGSQRGEWIVGRGQARLAGD